MALRAAPDRGWTPFQLALAAHLTMPHAVTSHWTAGALHGFPLGDLRRAPGGPAGDAHVITLGRHGAGGNIAVHQLRLAAADVVERSGLPITSPPRTALDLLSCLPPGSARDLWAWLSSRRILDVDGLAQGVGQRANWDGVGNLRRLLASVAGGAVSAAESRLHELLIRAGIDGWSAGVALTDDAGVIGVVDLLFEHGKLVVEVDGFRDHSSRDRFVADRRRQNRLVAAGYTVLRFTWDDLVHRPSDVIAQIRRAATATN
jgi:hypothetical protein